MGYQRPKGDGRGRLGGRQKGTPNKATAEAHKGFQDIFDNNIDNVQKHLDALARAEEHDKWLGYFLTLARYVVPTKAAVKVSEDTDTANLRAEIADTIYKEE